MRFRTTIPVIFLLLICTAAYSQTPGEPAQIQGDDTLHAHYYKEVDFIRYLQGRGAHRDALFLLHRLAANPELEVVKLDSLYDLLGWNYYSMKTLDSASRFWLKVSPASPAYLKSRFFSAWNKLYQGSTQEGEAVLLGLAPAIAGREQEQDWQAELLAFELAGVCLLQRDYRGYDSLSGTFGRQFYYLAAEEAKLDMHRDRLAGFRKKKLWKAGLMSAFLPGSGKIYAGKTGEGIAALLVVGALGLITRENFMKDGLTNWKTLLGGGIFSIYYIGNIWGSVFAAHRHNEAFCQAVDQHILLDLHIPLRNIFQ